MKKLITLIVALLSTSFSAFSQDTIPAGTEYKSYSHIYSYLDHMPEAPYNVNEFLARNINFPTDARDQGISGRVVLRFVIDEKGEISNITIHQSVSPSIDSEAVRVVRMMPSWKPGRTDEDEVAKVYVTLPIKFTLGDGRIPVAAPARPFVKPPIKGQVHYTADSKPKPGYSIARFISEVGVYPEDAKREKIQGSVKLKFIVTETGRIDSINVIKNLYPSMDSLAARLLEIMPSWKPALINGKPVNLWDSISLRFTLDGSHAFNVVIKQSISGPILSYAEQMPEPGVSINSYISSQVTSSNIAELVGTKGKVILKFIVTSTGDLDSFTVIKSLNPLVDTLAMTILDGMPPWTPAINAGKAVNVYYTTPIAFNFTADTNARQTLTQSTTSETTKRDSVYSYAEQMPEAGFDINQYLARAISYPPKARENKIAGRVVLKFVITKNGKIEDVTIQESVSPELDAEAIRVIKEMPDWKPARHNGEPVDVYFHFPIKFALN